MDNPQYFERYDFSLNTTVPLGEPGSFLMRCEPAIDIDVDRYMTNTGDSCMFEQCYLICGSFVVFLGDLAKAQGFSHLFREGEEVIVVGHYNGIIADRCPIGFKYTAVFSLIGKPTVVVRDEEGSGDDADTALANRARRA